MNNFTEEDAFLAEQGLNPYPDGALNPSDFDRANDELLQVLAAKEEHKRRRLNANFRPVPKTVPENMKQVYSDEYNRILETGNDPLLMYILQKHAQNGFTNGPIGTDGYYEQFDPELNPELQEEYDTFINTHYR